MPRGDEQHRNPKSDIEIAQAATMRPIGEIADKLGVPEDAVSPYGRYKAKISLDYVRSLADQSSGSGSTAARRAASTGASRAAGLWK